MPDDRAGGRAGDDGARVAGLHHVTAIGAEPQAMLDFYSGLLGLRLVKRTVNFDDPGTYHLYFGDAAGRPGTLMTFFPWPGAPRGRRGTGQVGATAFAVAQDAVGWWADRLRAAGVEVEGPVQRLGDQLIGLSDPDGLIIEIVGVEDGEPPDGVPDAPVDAERAIRGVHSVSLWVEGYERTADMLGRLGFEAAGDDGGRFRFAAPAAIGGVVDVVCMPERARGEIAVGTVHHVAFRARDEADQLRWRERMLDAGRNVTPVLDRSYFRSIYFREPGGVLFEIATDPPGFAIDEPPEALGESLRLPAWLEPKRSLIERALPPLERPRGAARPA
jgi:glyoxalase family protein